MKLATLGDIVHLKLDHQVGALVNESTGKKVALGSYVIVYARYGKRLFKQDRSAKWSLECGSEDAVTGSKRDGGTPACGTRNFCADCKPTLYLGLLGGDGTMYVLSLTASAARTLGDDLQAMSATPDPIYLQAWKMRLMQTDKGTMSYVQISTARTGPRPEGLEEAAKARSRLAPVVDQKAAVRMGGPAKKAMPSLKM